MKKLYTLSIALAMVAFGTQSFAQVRHNQTVPQSTKQLSIDNSDKSFPKQSTATPKDGELEIFWSEDFSNGFDGMDDNGAWTVGEENGNLWFQTFPINEPNGYDPDLPILDGLHLDYLDKLPGYYSGDVVVSPTRDNGVMMLDLDRYNANEDNNIRATLISPAIDLSGLEDTGDLILSFYERIRLCCQGGSTVTVDVSLDGGATWPGIFDAYNDIEGGNQVNQEVRIDISSLTGDIDPADLDDIRIRFNWGEANTTIVAYFWQVDDVSIQRKPDNDLLAHKSFTNNWIDYRDALLDETNTEEEDSLITSQYFLAMEHYEEPVYYARPLNFAMVVSNEGLETQTSVNFEVTGTSPSGATHVWTSEEDMELESGVKDTLRMGVESFLSEISGEYEVGQYTFDFVVFQNEAEQRPEDNIGDSRGLLITNEEDNDGYAMLRNDPNVSSSSVYAEWMSNMIWSNMYVFSDLHEGVEPKYITHVEAVILNITGHAETHIGELIYFNAREDGNVLFGTSQTDYSNQELEFEIAADDLWSTADGLPFNWASFELPSPILITPGVTYQAEYNIPDSNEDIVYPLLSDAKYQEGSVTYVYDRKAENAQWATYRNGSTENFINTPIRFRTATSTVGLEKITVESGITLVQNYPNPFTDQTNIQFMLEEPAKVKLEVRDLSGKLVFTKDFGSVAANIAQRYDLQRGSLAAGMYTYTIATSDFQVSRKLMVE